MHMRDILQRDSTTFSFEFFPPQNDEARDALRQRMVSFRALEPSFVSVTSGAGGTTRERTLDLVLQLKRDEQLDTVPHLTCVGHSDHEIEQIIRRYAEAGVERLIFQTFLPRDLEMVDLMGRVATSYSLPAGRRPTAIASPLRSRHRVEEGCQLGGTGHER